MKKVITYGTYDLLHFGHENLLRRAKALGDYLIVGVTSDNFDKERGKLNVHNNVLERVEAVRRTGYADEIIIEDYEGQKIEDIQKYGIDIFAIGSDWEGKFDYLKEYCEVIYLPRTKGVSSTQLRAQATTNCRLGIIGSGRIAQRFIPESAFVSGVEITSIFNPDIVSAEKLAKEFDIPNYTSDLEKFWGEIDAVYIAAPHDFHYIYAKSALENGKHVLCEIPLTLNGAQASELYEIAKKRKLVLLEASKTAHAPAWTHLVVLIKSGIIGDVVDVKASLSKLVSGEVREMDAKQSGGSMTELSPFPLMAIIKLLGCNYKDVKFYSKMKNGVDIYTSGTIVYDNAIASLTLGLGVKTEGNLVVSGSKGYVLVPSPWWLTNYFEVNFEDRNKNKKYFYKYDGDGLRYELQEFISMIVNKRFVSYRLNHQESICIAQIIETYLSQSNTTILK